MKKVIQIRVTDTKQWIGGLYYKRNILFSLIQNPVILDNYNIIVTVSKDNINFFSEFISQVKIIALNENSKIGKIKLFFMEISNKVNYVFPAVDNIYRKLLNITSISWLADFQHNYYPEFFSLREQKKRASYYEAAKESKMPLVLSSNTCKEDFIKFYGEKNNIYVIPFVSYIEPELKQITSELEKKILSKYNLENKRFACVSNQFWKHKNHIIVLRAIKKLHSNLGGFEFVFTGLPKDYRNPDYYNSLIELSEDPNIKKHIQILGFIERIDQLIVMKNAEFIIQPSLFEGWGTVVEDAKVLDKTILLSDIPVHREQMNDRCILFDPHDHAALADLIEQEINKEHHDDIKAGIADMYKRAGEYSKEFERLLEDMG